MSAAMLAEPWTSSASRAVSEKSQPDVKGNGPAQTAAEVQCWQLNGFARQPSSSRVSPA